MNFDGTKPQTHWSCVECGKKAYLNGYCPEHQHCQPKEAEKPEPKPDVEGWDGVVPFNASELNDWQKDIREWCFWRDRALTGKDADNLVNLITPIIAEARSAGFKEGVETARLEERRKHQDIYNLGFYDAGIGAPPRNMNP